MTGGIFHGDGSGWLEGVKGGDDDEMKDYILVYLIKKRTSFVRALTKVNRMPELNMHAFRPYEHIGMSTLTEGMIDLKFGATTVRVIRISTNMLY